MLFFSHSTAQSSPVASPLCVEELSEGLSEKIDFLAPLDLALCLGRPDSGRSDQTLLGAPGHTTSNKKLLGAPGLTTRSKDANYGQ